MFYIFKNKYISGVLTDTVIICLKSKFYVFVDLFILVDGRSICESSIRTCSHMIISNIFCDVK